MTWPILLASFLGVGLGVWGGLWLRRPRDESHSIPAPLTGRAEILEAVLDSMEEGVAVADTDGHFLLVNPAQRRMLGREVQAEDPSEWPSYYGAHRVDTGEPLVEEDLILLKALRGESPASVEVFFERPSHAAGRTFARATARPLRDEQGDLWGGVLVMYDTTEKRRVEAERADLVRDLEARNAELERFTYTISHDLKSPLVTMTGFLDLLRRDLELGDRDRIASDLERIAEAARSMDQLIRDLLELARIGRVVGTFEDIDLGPLAEELVSEFGSAHPDVVFHVGHNFPTVRGDRLRLRELLQNLIENAIKFSSSEPEPRVGIAVRQDGDESVVFVEDNGIGIDPAYHEKIFGLFNRLDVLTEGSGVGLAIVRRIVETHDGRVWVESEGAGQGTRVCVAMPVEPAGDG